MSRVVKLLERKGFMQFWGFVLIAAPVANTLAFIFLQKSQNPLLYSQLSFWKVLSTGTPLHYALALCSFALGVMMLRGSQKTWGFFLGLLGVHILIQLFHLGENIRQSWLWGVFFLANAGVFAFIADQLVFKLEDPRTKNLNQKPITDIPKPRRLSRVVVGFEDYGPWAELVEVNNTQIHVRKTKDAPQDIEKRFVEFSFKRGVKLKAKYKNHDATNYYFQFINMKDSESKELNSWIERNAS